MLLRLLTKLIQCLIRQSSAFSGSNIRLTRRRETVTLFTVGASFYVYIFGDNWIQQILLMVCSLFLSHVSHFE